jgi:ubiquinone/menaquinone biosynthesis C-methylase UbiE
MTNYIEINKQQLISEIDPFTVKRYIQFSTFMKNSSNPVILDIGCNTGRGGRILKDQLPNCRVTGIDIVEERLKMVPENIYEKLINASITDIPLDDCSVDYIVAGEVIEHIAGEDIEKVLGEFKRILKNKGMLLMTTPNPNSLLVKLGNDAVLKDPSHLSVMSIERHKLLLKQFSFRDIKIFGSGKAITYIPARFPLMAVFGSYLSVSTK